MIGTGLKPLNEFIRKCLLDTYIKIEKKLKFKSRALLYLLNLFQKDVTKMLLQHNSELVKNRADNFWKKKQSSFLPTEATHDEPTFDILSRHSFDATNDDV